MQTTELLPITTQADKQLKTREGDTQQVNEITVTRKYTLRLFENVFLLVVNHFVPDRPFSTIPV